jgi:integrase
VFFRGDGTRIHPDAFSKAFGCLVARTSLPRIRLHDLRHTHATIGLKAGVPVKVIAESLGHENPAFTMKQYADVIQGMQADASRAIASIVRNAAPVTTESSPTTSPASDVGLT